MRAQIHYPALAFLLIGMCTALLMFSGVASAQELNKDQQKCINALNKNLQKVASKQGKEICTCIKDGSKGKLGSQTIEECLTADNDGKVKKAKDKTKEDAAKKCPADPNDPAFPPFGATDPNTVNEVAVQKELDLVHAIFGTDLDSVIAVAADEKRRAKCQQTVLGKVKKCQSTKLKAFNKCKKFSLKLGADDSTDLEACMLGVENRKIAKACGEKGKIPITIGKKCVSVDLLSAFPGCGTVDSTGLAFCLDEIVECQVCLALNQADALARDCDDFDDELANGSCP